MPTDPSHVVYSAQLTLISFLTTPVSNPKSSPAPATSNPAKPPTTSPHQRSGTSTLQPSPQDVHAALAAVEELEDRATRQNHNHVALLARVLSTRIRVAAGMWGDVREAIRRAEAALGLSYEPASTPKPRKPLQQSQSNGVADVGGKPVKVPAPAIIEQTFIMFENPFEAAMAVHLLMLSVIYYTHSGEAAEVSPRVSHLHALLDSEVLDKFPDGHVEVIRCLLRQLDLWLTICASFFADCTPRWSIASGPGDTSSHIVPPGFPHQQHVETRRGRSQTKTEGVRHRGPRFVGC